MKVLKFGGTSVGSAERIKDVARLVKERGRNIVVLSAMSGTTNTLVEISGYLHRKNINSAKDTINHLEDRYRRVLAELYTDSSIMQEAINRLDERFSLMRSLAHDGFGEREEKIMLAQGELMSTAMMELYMREQGVKCVWLPALEFMRTDSNGEADVDYITEILCPMLEEHADADLFVTQGFICRNAAGDIDNLQRGGSDLTASLIGAAIHAEEIEIWTDIDGMHNNDPRYVERTTPVAELHFDEAAELAYFGAKILHPTCVMPAKFNNIPIRVLNTMEPEARGTLIYNTVHSRSIKAVAAKDGVMAVKIKSSRMLMASGFIHRVFEIFDNYKRPIDMIATSEVGISVTIDNPLKLEHIIDELKEIGTVTVDYDMVIICVVGDLEWHNRGFEAKAVAALSHIPVRMISYGGSNYNISFLVKAEDKVGALNALTDALFPAE